MGVSVEREAVEVTAVVDGARFGPYTLVVSVLTTLALVFDGFDIQAIAFAAPKLMSEWGIDRAALAPILAAGLLGMFVGALVLGMVGDRYGRRRALLASIALMAVSSLLAATADGPAKLGTWRFLTGLGLGGALPNAAALMVEFARSQSERWSSPSPSSACRSAACWAQRSRPDSCRRSAGRPSSCSVACCRDSCCSRWPGGFRNRRSISRAGRRAQGSSHAA